MERLWLRDFFIFDQRSFNKRSAIILERESCRRSWSLIWNRLSFLGERLFYAGFHMISSEQGTGGWWLMAASIYSICLLMNIRSIKFVTINLMIAFDSHALPKHCKNIVTCRLLYLIHYSLFLSSMLPSSKSYIYNSWL